MNMMRAPQLMICAVILVLALPVAHAAGASEGTVRGELRQELAEARQEIRTDLAAARAELTSGNLDLGESLRLGGDGEEGVDAGRAKAAITPGGDLLIDGVAVDLDANQRRELIDYRGQVITIALAGMDIGEQAALAAIDSVDRGMFRLIIGAMTGSLERNLKKNLSAMIEPTVASICQALPGLYASQQRLAGSVPEFGPYATLEQDEVRNCEADVRREFAGLSG